ncbi:sensor histidine kinase [candidate division KSB1 bacterium]|nr:sensor histidine kinase [candidate division KSB1 bacterium]
MEVPQNGNASVTNTITFFAPAERVSADQLLAEIKIISENPVIDGLLHTIGGLLAVLNEQRQIVAVNETLIKMLGVTGQSQIFGLRPGEAIQCVHAQDSPGGCGTSKFCATCGAAIAIVSSLGINQPVEKECAISVQKNQAYEDLYLRVRSCPLSIYEQKFLLLFIQDISAQQRRAVLERTFFHDLINLITGLLGTTELLNETTEPNQLQLIQQVQQITQRLAREVNIQRLLLHDDLDALNLNQQRVQVARIIDELRAIFTNHPLTHGKIIRYPESLPGQWLRTDTSLLLRVLINMLVNALEAAANGDEVKLSAESTTDAVTFYVWNRQMIPVDIAIRIFQRNFSTKLECGRGLGTYAMKLLGEKYLGGRVQFVTSAIHGTTFQIQLPLNLD